MAATKQFGLAGVSADVQFGKGGARLQQAGDAFLVKTAADALTKATSLSVTQYRVAPSM